MQTIPGFDELPWRKRARVRVLAFVQRALSRHAALVQTSLRALPEPVVRVARRTTAPLRVHGSKARVDPESVLTREAIPTCEAPRASIVIPTHSAERWLRACLAALAEHTRNVPYEVIVVDDGSPRPGAIATIVAEHPGATLVRHPESRGFAAAVNRGAAEARGDALVVLNDDVLVTPGWLSSLLEVLDAEPDAAWVGPATNDSGDEATIDAQYARLEELVSFASRVRGAPRDVEKLALFCAVLRKSDFDDAGGVDESYGRGLFEDDDLCMKLHSAGRRVVLAPSVFVHHAAGATFRQLDALEYLARFEINRRRFERRWHRRWRAP